MKKIIICNDTRSHESSENFPWARFLAFNQTLNALLGSRKIGSYDYSYPDPLIKYRYLESSIGFPSIAPELEREFLELVRIADQERELTNVDGHLCRTLRARNHIVRIFDAHRLNVMTQLWSHEGDSNRGAADLIEMVTEIECDTLIYDLDYFGGPNYGRNMLQMMSQRQAKPGHVIVYSKFLHDPGNTPEELKQDFPDFRFDFVDRFGGGGIPQLQRLIEGGNN